MLSRDNVWLDVIDLLIWLLICSGGGATGSTPILYWRKSTAKYQDVICWTIIDHQMIVSCIDSDFHFCHVQLFWLVCKHSDSSEKCHSDVTQQKWRKYSSRFTLFTLHSSTGEHAKLRWRQTTTHLSAGKKISSSSRFKATTWPVSATFRYDDWF